MFGALDGNPGASRLDAPDRLIDREAGWEVPQRSLRSVTPES